jgi:uncharacterized cupredoxin-like copper-binding protein
MTLLLAAILLHLGFPNTGATTYYPSTTKTTMVTVRASDFKFALSKTTVPHGRITFVIKNTGHTPHDFSIAGHTSSRVKPGKTTRLTVTLKKGRYPYRCTVDSHAKLGMKGVLHVT